MSYDKITICYNVKVFFSSHCIKLALLVNFVHTNVKSWLQHLHAAFTLSEPEPVRKGEVNPKLNGVGNVTVLS